jgi:MFS family permease
VASLACALFLIDLIGRKRSLLIGITLQIVASLYIAIYLNQADGVDDPSSEAPSLQRASTGAIVMIFVSGVAWAVGYVPIECSSI